METFKIILQNEFNYKKFDWYYRWQPLEGVKGQFLKVMES